MVTVNTDHCTHPWVLRIHSTEVSEERYATEKEAVERADQLKVYGSDDLYLIELFVDAGCLYAVG